VEETAEYIKMTAEVVSAYVGNNNLSPADLPGLIREVHQAFCGTVGGPGATAAAPNPAIAIKRSVTNEYIVCLECGKHFKSLKRHLNTHHGLKPPEYREKWSLPFDYPMVAPAYAKERSKLAIDMGLGKKQGSARRRKRSAKTPVPAL
jgi:predicted transcriptional regulator